MNHTFAHLAKVLPFYWSSFQADRDYSGHKHCLSLKNGIPVVSVSIGRAIGSMKVQMTCDLPTHVIGVWLLEIRKNTQFGLVLV